MDRGEEMRADGEIVENVFEKQKMKLRDISKDLNSCTLAMERSKEKLRNVSALVCANKWSATVLGRALKNDGMLQSTKTREDIGRISDRLMQLLLSLDAVESFGDGSIRNRRRELVKKVNTKLIPRAENLIKRARALENWNHAVLEALRSKENEGNMEEEEEDNPGMEEFETHEDQQGAVGEEDEEEEQEPLRKKQLSEKDLKEKTKLKPRFKINEDERFATILCEIPSGVSIRNIEVSLDGKNGDLVCFMGPHAEPLHFDVTSPSLKPFETVYQLKGRNVLQIQIPKKHFRRQMDYPQRSSPFVNGGVQRRAFSRPFRNFTPIWGL